MFIVILGDPPASPSKHGRLHLTFTERSPFSALKTMAGRHVFAGDLGRDIGDILRRTPTGSKEHDVFEYDLSEESFEAFVPLECSPGTPCGLFVFISAGAAEVSPDWFDVFSRHHLIWVSPNNAGNHRVDPIRMALALDAVHNLKKLYRIDEKRVYISGFSGGAHASARLVTGFPDVFSGAYLMMGGFFDEIHSGPNGQMEPTVLMPRWGAPVETLKKNLRLLLMTGERDDVVSPRVLYATYHGLMLDGFERVSLLDVPRWPHAHPPVEWFEKGLVALEAAKPHKPPTTSPTKQANPQPGQIAQAKRLLATAEMFVRRDPARAAAYLRELIDEYPTTPAAIRARQLLKTITQPASAPSRTR